MRKKICWSGNSAALVLDKTLLCLLGWRVGTYVSIETDGKSIILQRARVQDKDAFNPRTEEIGAATDSHSVEQFSVPGMTSSTELKRLVMRAPVTCKTLFEKSVPFEIVQKLFHQPMPEPDMRRGEALGWVAAIGPYQRWARAIRCDEVTAADIATMQRFEALWAHRKEDWFGGSWEESAEVALAEVPMLREPDSVPTPSLCAEAAQSVSS